MLPALPICKSCTKICILSSYCASRHLPTEVVERVNIRPHQAFCGRLWVALHLHSFPSVKVCPEAVRISPFRF